MANNLRPDGFGNTKHRENKNGTPYFKGTVEIGNQKYTCIVKPGKTDNMVVELYKWKRNSYDNRR